MNWQHKIRLNISWEPKINCKLHIFFQFIGYLIERILTYKLFKCIFLIKFKKWSPTNSLLGRKPFTFLKYMCIMYLDVFCGLIRFLCILRLINTLIIFQWFRKSILYKNYCYDSFLFFAFIELFTLSQHSLFFMSSFSRYLKNRKLSWYGEGESVKTSSSWEL